MSGWADFRYSPPRNPADLKRVREIQVPSPLFLGGLAVGEPGSCDPNGWTLPTCRRFQKPLAKGAVRTLQLWTETRL